MRLSRTLAVGLLTASSALALTAVIPASTADAEVCGSVGRRISVSACGSPIENWAVPPSDYAPMPEDFDAVPPPPPPPQINVCANVGRRINISGCI